MNARCAHSRLLTPGRALPWALVALLSPAPSLAQPVEIAPEDVRAQALGEVEEVRQQGWTPRLTVGSTAAYGHSSQVVGSPDGSTVQIGVLVDGGATLARGQHEWDNGLLVKHTQTRTPLMDRFIKSSDSLDLVSTYLYHLEAIDWLGPYARFKLSTQIFAGYEVRTDDVVVRRVPLDGVAPPPETIKAEQDIPLTDPFEPMILRESAGAFANPVETKRITVKGKLGAGVQQILAQGGYKLADDDATPELELLELEGSQQAGAEAEVDLSGQVSEGVSWKAKANLFMPFVTSLDDGQTGLDGLNTDLSAGVSVKLAKWASLDYTLSAKKIPALVDEWQVLHGVSLSAGFDLL